MAENNITIYSIESNSDINNIKLVITNKNSNGTEKPTTQNGYIILYKWKVDGQIVQSGSSEGSRYYFPKSEDINKTISCEVTAVSVYDENILVTKSSFIKITTDIINETDFVAETDIVVETDFVAETDIVVETDFVAETDIVVETDFVAETDIVVETDFVAETDIVVETDFVVETDIVNEPAFIPDFRITETDILDLSYYTELTRINSNQLIGVELILLEKNSTYNSLTDVQHINELIENAESISYTWYYNDTNETVIGTESSYIIKEEDINQQISCKITVTGLDGNVIEKISNQDINGFNNTIITWVIPTVIDYTIDSVVIEDDNGPITQTIEITNPLESDFSLYGEANSPGGGDQYFIWTINNVEVSEYDNNDILDINQDIIDAYFVQGNNEIKFKITITQPDMILCYGEYGYENNPVICPSLESESSIIIVVETDIVNEPAFIPDFRITETDILDLSDYTELTRINSNQLIGVELILLEKNSTYNSLTDVQHINELIENAESISYTWYYNDTNETVIGTESSYIIKEEDINQQISCKITVTGLDGNVIEKISNQTINVFNNTILTWVIPRVIEYTIDSVVIEDDNGPITQTIEITNPLESDFSLYGVANYTGGNEEYLIWTINNVEVSEYDNTDILDINQDIIDAYFVQGNNEIKFKITITQPDMILCYGEYGYENNPVICPSLESESSIITILMT